MKRRWGVRGKTILTMAILSIIPVIIMGAISIQQSRRILVEKLDDLTRKNMEILNQQVSNKLDLLAVTVQQLPQSQLILDIVQNPPDTHEAFLRNQTQISQELYSTDYLRRLGNPSTYAIVFDESGCYSSIGHESDQVSQSICQRLEQNDWYQDLMAYNYSRIWMGVATNVVMQNGGQQLYVAGNVIVNGKNEGVVVLGVSTLEMQKMLRSAHITEHSSIFLTNDTREYTISTSDEPIDPAVLDAPSGSTVWADGRECLVMTSAVEPQGTSEEWTLCMLVPISDMYEEVSLLTWLILGMILVCCVLIAIMMVCMDRWLVHPIMHLSDGMKRVQQGDMTARVNMEYQDEIGDLCVGFNSMVETLDTSIRQIRQEEEKKRKLEIQMLQEQINPHFVRNTLNTIRWMAELKGAAGISRAISAFVGMIDYSFGGVENFVCLRDELFYLEQYIYIQKIRYQNLFTYQVHVPEELLDARIPKLILQPIVENSVLHGIGEKEEMGIICVEACTEGDQLLLYVRDDGVGMDEEKIRQILNGTNRPSRRGSTHIGVRNVHDRLRLIYGENYGMQIESKVDQYTNITLRIPLKLDEEKECHEQFDQNRID